MAVLSDTATAARSATQYITSALRLVGALRSGLSLSAAELNDSLLVLNDMLDAFSTERILIPAVTVQKSNQNGVTLALVGGQQAYKLGNVLGTEDFLLPRPVRVERASVLYSASQSTPAELPMDMVDDVKWQGIANKSVPSILPQVCFVDASNAVFPDTILYFWPVPTQPNPVILYVWTALQSFPDLTSAFLFPPAYAEFLRYQLAMRLAAEFPCDLQKFQVVKTLADAAKIRIAGMNAIPKEAVCDEAIVGSHGKMGNIYTGTVNRSLRN
ncbi:MAG: hypothetical protein ACLPLR_09620 [Terriglobales bacterium]